MGEHVRVVMVSKALIVGAYQRKAEEIARLGVDLTVLTPPSWRDRRGRQVAERRHTQGYTLRTIPIRLAGNYHLHFYPTLRRELARLDADILHMDEEPYNLATWLALRTAASLHMRTTFFTWQNLQRNYPLPFRWFEQQNYRRAKVTLAGNQDAAQVLRRKGYAGQIAVIPQFGVDPILYAPHAPRPGRQDAGAPGPVAADESRPLQIGYAGGLLLEKGVDLLLEACTALRGDWLLSLVGEGDQLAALTAQAARLGIADRVCFCGRRSSSDMPEFYRSLDVLALPSRSLPTWKEQFGRVLIEAMACGVVVVGSSCGEIPNVIGQAGLIFPENDAAALASHLQQLIDQPDLRTTLALAARQRVLDHFTMQQIGQATVSVYRQLMASDPPRHILSP